MKREDFALIIGLALPVIFMIILAIAIYLPNLSVKPQHNFIYTLPQYSYHKEYQMEYFITDNHIAQKQAIVLSQNNNAVILPGGPDLYFYDVHKDTSHQLTYKEAEQYTLVPGPSSPDGYTVTYNYSHGGIFELFGSGSDKSGMYISSGKGSKKLTGIQNTRYYNYSNINIIGWVK